MNRIVIAGAVIAAGALTLGAADKDGAVYAPGAGANDRPRMVVVNFRAATGDTFSWYGKNESAAMWAATVADKINERFTQTRKFTMIDRKFDAEVKDEIARLSDKNAAKGDIVRLCQRLGTDYMVVGDVRFASVQAPGVNPVTGQAMSAAPQRFAEIGYRVILAPTGEIAWADTVTVDTTDVPAADLLSFVSLSTDCAARRIAEGVEANLLSRTSACGGSCGSAEASGCPSGASAVPPSGTSVRGTGNGGIVTPF